MLYPLSYGGRQSQVLSHRPGRRDLASESRRLEHTNSIQNWLASDRQQSTAEMVTSSP